MLVAILAYVAVQLVIGLVVSRRVKSEGDYLLAGRRLGYPLTVFSVFATWFGAETCIGSAGAAYRGGLSGATADPLGYSLCLLLMGLLFAVPLWRRGLATFADLFAERYGARAERISVLIVAPTSLMWAAAQVRAFGQVLGASSSLNTEVAIAIAAGFVIAYTTAGGMLADAVTDLVQGLVLVAGLVTVMVLFFMGGDARVLAEVPSDRLTFAPPGTGTLDLLEAWSVPILGSVMAPELVQRVLSARSPTVARRGTLIATGLYFSMGVIPVVLALASAQLLPDLVEPEQVLLHSAARYLPPVLYVVFAGALVSAILSTVDTALLVAGSLIAHNIVLKWLPPGSQARDRAGRDGQSRAQRALRINRLTVALCGLVAYALARSTDGVYELVEEASAFGSAGIVVCAVFALFSRFGGANSATASLLAGVFVYAGAAYLFDLRHPYLISLAAALGAYVVVALREGQGVPAPGE